MKKIKTTYKELHEKLGSNPNQEFFVKTNTGSFAKIEATVHKKSNTYTVEFDNGVVFKAGDAHAFMDDTDSAVTVENLKPGHKIKTLDGTCAVTAVYDFLEDQDVYDITVEAPHWYTNDESHGIIHHNTSFALLMASAYLKKHKESVLMFYDSEFGSPQSYFESFGIDTSRVLHVPIKNIEELKFDLVNQLETIDRKDKVIVVIDSVGNLASKKELDDALNEKSVADMTRAKSLKGLFRMVTPYLTLKNIPLLAINHTYQTQEMFSKAVVSGGTGIMYSCDNCWIIGRQQDKDGTEIQGYHFIINIEKSRFVKEKSKIPISVSWKGGIEKWSGLLDIALEGGYVIKPKNGWYMAINPETKAELSKAVREAGTMTKDFWEGVFKNTNFATYIKNKYTIGLRDMIDSSSDDFDYAQNVEQEIEKI
jgi:RecA/RadA recombinase